MAQSYLVERRVAYEKEATATPFLDVGYSKSMISRVLAHTEGTVKVTTLDQDLTNDETSTEMVR